MELTSDDQPGSLPFHWPSPTPFRLVFTVTILTCGTAKIVLSLQGSSMGSAFIEWLLVVYYGLL
jgi:hypothetical protein